MPEKSVSGSSGKASGASEVEAGAPEPTKATAKKAPKKIRIEAGGHVAYVDPPPPTPDPVNTCSICGQDAVTCPHGEATGWAVEGG